MLNDTIDYNEIDIVKMSNRASISIIRQYIPDSIHITVKNRRLNFLLLDTEPENEDVKYVQQDNWFTAFVILGTPKGVLLPSNKFEDPGSGLFYNSIGKVIDRYNMKVNKLKSPNFSFTCLAGLDQAYNAKTGLMYIFQKTRFGSRMRYLIVFLEDNCMLVCYELNNKKQYKLIKPTYSNKFRKTLSPREIFISLLRKHLGV